MRTHLQGLIVLLAALAGLWGTARLAGPAVGDALRGDGAVAAASSDDVVDLATATDEPADEPLTGDEIAELQAGLLFAGYDPGPIDGIMGPSTRAAVTAAIADLGLGDGIGDRGVLEALRRMAREANAAAEASSGTLGEPGPGSSVSRPG